jgi:cell division protein FtsB
MTITDYGDCVRVLIFLTEMSIILLFSIQGGEPKMKKAISVILSFALVSLFIVALVGCGADIKAENEKLKAENTSIKSDNDKLKLEVQKLKEEIQKAAEKEATIGSLTAENEALKKQVEDLKAQLTKKKK